MLRAAIIVLLVALLPSHAWAEARLALLIGNEAYATEIGRLGNPHNDVALLQQVLKGLGFDVVVERDAGLGALTRAVNAYARRVQAAGPNAVGFFYYSGHGASDGIANYLIPVDVKTTETGELWDQSMQLTEITRKLKRDSSNATHFVVFDACRNTLKLTQPGSKAVVQSKGFVPVAQENGMLIAYATAEGELASDVGAGAGPYAQALAEEIVKPGIEAVVMFRAVQRRVRAAIHQEPYLGFNALGDVYLAGRNEQPTGPTQILPPGEAKALTYTQYVEAFEKGQPVTRGTPFTIEEMGSRAASEFESLTEPLAGTRWQGGGSWGTIAFDATGRTAEYYFSGTPGRLVLQGVLGSLSRAADQILVGEWQEGENKENRGGLILNPGSGEIKVRWGPRFLHEATWTRAEEQRGHAATAAEGGAPAPKATAAPSKQQVAIATPPPPSHCDGVEFIVGQDERRCFKPGVGKTEWFKDCPTCPEMVVVPAGGFTMGSPANEPERSSYEAQVRVSIAAPFAVGRFAVTFDEWDACVADGGCNGHKPDDRGWGRAKHPVINVNWDDAKAYAAWLSRRTGKTYRLLSEAEREYVTRAGSTTPFWWGTSITPKQANYDGSADPYKGGGSKGENRQRTVRVDSFEPNPWGLYNVHGNVWEWTEDCWNDSNTGNPGDGGARTTGNCSSRVVRGGSWYSGPRILRSAYRYWSSTDFRYDIRGFRLARTLNP